MGLLDFIYGVILLLTIHDCFRGTKMEYRKIKGVLIKRLFGINLHKKVRNLRNNSKEQKKELIFSRSIENRSMFKNLKFILHNFRIAKCSISNKYYIIYLGTCKRSYVNRLCKISNSIQIYTDKKIYYNTDGDQIKSSGEEVSTKISCRYFNTFETAEKEFRDMCEYILKVNNPFVDEICYRNNFSNKCVISNHVFNEVENEKPFQIFKLKDDQHLKKTIPGNADNLISSELFSETLKLTGAKTDDEIEVVYDTLVEIVEMNHLSNSK